MRDRAKCRLVATILINPCDEHHTLKWDPCACVNMAILCLHAIWQIASARIAGFCEQIKTIATGKLFSCSISIEFRNVRRRRTSTRDLDATFIRCQP